MPRGCEPNHGCKLSQASLADYNNIIYVMNSLEVSITELGFVVKSNILDIFIVLYSLKSVVLECSALPQIKANQAALLLVEYI